MKKSVISEISNVERVFAIGDLHGCADEVARLLEHLERKEGLSDNDAVIFLGDYIDRGPDTKGVIDLMLEYQRKLKNAHFLKGNHEEMLLGFLGFGGHMEQAFLYNGGLETMHSYGISVFAPPEEMVSAFPEEHFKFICELEHLARFGNFLYVHAGLNPSVPLDSQVGDDILWIRDQFIAFEHDFDLTVVFGHTPSKEIFVHYPYKVGIDTGLVFGNMLSCVEVTSRRLYQIKRNSKRVVTRKLNAKFRESIFG